MNGSPSNVTIFAVLATLTYDVMSTTNSSPQTTEINADKRAESLMKWVHLGLAQAALFAAIAVTIEIQEGHAWWPPALGFSLAAALLYAQYVHAKNSGLENPGTPTETY